MNERTRRRLAILLNFTMAMVLMALASASVLLGVVYHLAIQG